jgi:hypothetical protein
MRAPGTSPGGEPALWGPHQRGEGARKVARSKARSTLQVDTLPEAGSSAAERGRRAYTRNSSELQCKPLDHLETRILGRSHWLNSSNEGRLGPNPDIAPGKSERRKLADSRMAALGKETLKSCHCSLLTLPPRRAPRAAHHRPSTWRQGAGVSGGKAGRGRS